MPWCSQRALGPELLAGPGQEGDHVMLGHRLDRVDRGDVDLAQHVGVIGGADRGGVLGRDHADLAHRLGREHLDLPPDAVAVFGRPDGGHFGAGIAGDHGRAASRADRSASNQAGPDDREALINGAGHGPARAASLAACAVLVVGQDGGPIGVAASDRFGLVGFPQLFRAGVEVQIELAVDDLPEVRIARSEIMLADRPRAIAAELRRIALGIGLERGERLRGFETPFGSAPFESRAMPSLSPACPAVKKATGS